MIEGDEARLALLQWLKRSGYRFVTPTPATHRRRLRSLGGNASARDLRDVFGWNLPFAETQVGAGVLDLLQAAQAVELTGGRLRSRLRVASLEADLYLHSAFPTGAEGVFFGPDSYRFARFLAARLSHAPPGGDVLDMGAGAGIGAVMAARAVMPMRLVLADVNPQALALARVNLAAAGIEGAEFVLADGLDGVAGHFDVIVSNPPFMANAQGRTYCHGGDLHGARCSVDWTVAARRRLYPGGRFLLYSGSAIVRGQDQLLSALRDALPHDRALLRYEELDPDIFGEVLTSQAYEGVERIAAIGAEVVA